MSARDRLTFFKSSYSGNRAECVEVAHITDFKKSSYSGVDGECVEVADLPSGAAIRDSKHPANGHLPFSSPEWDAFLTIARASRP